MCQGRRVQFGAACQRADNAPLRQGQATGRHMVAELRRYRFAGTQQCTRRPSACVGIPADVDIILLWTSYCASLWSSSPCTAHGPRARTTLFGVTSHRDAGQTSKLLASQGLMLEAEQRDVSLTRMGDSIHMLTSRPYAHIPAICTHSGRDPGDVRIRVQRYACRAFWDRSRLCCCCVSPCCPCCPSTS